MYMGQIDTEKAQETIKHTGKDMSAVGRSSSLDLRLAISGLNSGAPNC